MAPATFLDDGVAARRDGSSETVARARAARQARQAEQAAAAAGGGQPAAQKKVAAALALQRRARLFMTACHGRPALRQDWDRWQAASSGGITAGGQLALTNWLLRFFQPVHDEERLRALVGSITVGMEQERPEHMFAAAGLRRELALRWVDTLRRLTLALARQLAAAPALSGATPTAAVAVAEARRLLSARFGPVLRLALQLGDPESWKLVTQLAASPASVPASQALMLMSHSATAAAARPLVAALGVFTRELHAQLDPALLGAAVTIAARAVQQPQADAPLIAAFAFGVLAVPALPGRLSTASTERLRRGDLLWTRCVEHGPYLAGKAAKAFSADADGALCLTGNLLALLPVRSANPQAALLVGGARLMTALLSVAPASGKGGSTFHQLRGWSSRAPEPALIPHLDALQAQLELLWSPGTLRLFYTDDLCAALGTKPPDARLGTQDVQQLQNLAARAQIVASMHALALRRLPPLKPRAIARLAYSSHLVPCLWSLLRRLPTAGGGGDGARGLLTWLLSAGAALDAEPLLPLLMLMLEGIAHLFPVIDDAELFIEQHPFSPHDLAQLASFLNQLAFGFIWEAPSASLAQEAHKALRDATARLLTPLTDRDARRPFCAPGAWLIGRLSMGQLRRELDTATPRAKALMSTMPWAVPFDERVNFFRELVSKEKAILPNEQLPEHIKGTRVKIRREHILEDGYVQLSGLSPEQLKGTIRVEFVSELGMAEAGIDRTGVFKEFLEEVVKKAFDADRGLFVHTSSQRIQPSPTSELADPNHVRLFEFVGRMLGKALYEGIVLDLPLADFFVAKFLGKINSLDELPSLDKQLHSSLDHLKRYDGDVENDLCLSFVVDEEAFGERRTVELIDGGRVMPVTADNRIEYIHLIADYHLNKRLATQSKAVVAGLTQVVPAGWLRFFTTPELQRLIGGDDVALDVADLKRHTRYAGGYNEFSPTIRDLWAVLADFSREDRALLLKFVTSCSKPPLLGFAHLQPPFTVQCVSSDGNEVPSVMAFFGMGRKETSRLPSSATCFNLLKLPNFKSRKVSTTSAQASPRIPHGAPTHPFLVPNRSSDLIPSPCNLPPKVLREKLLYAIRAAAGFELS